MLNTKRIIKHRTEHRKRDTHNFFCLNVPYALATLTTLYTTNWSNLLHSLLFFHQQLHFVYIAIGIHLPERHGKCGCAASRLCVFERLCAISSLTRSVKKKRKKIIEIQMAGKVVLCWLLGCVVTWKQYPHTRITRASAHTHARQLPKQV